jgi:integral membrane protein (TIGR01906 family)
MKRLFLPFTWLVSLAVPILLLITAVFILMRPAFLEFEYRQPDFPPDTFGFTTNDRLQYAGVAVEYLVNSANISFLGNETFPNGTSLYQPQELSHMQDVKTVVQKTFFAWWIIFIGMIAVAVWGRSIGWFSVYLKALANGGWLTIALILVSLIFVFTSFYDLFTWFHELFFTSGTWMFAYSDTLIRLFPLRFWQDAFIFAGGFAFIGGLLFGIVGRYFSRKVK